MPLPMSASQVPISLDTFPISAQSAASEAANTHSLKYADELFGSGYEVMERHYHEDGSYLGKGALNLFCQALYDHPFQDPRDYHYMDTTFAFVGFKIRPSHFLRYTEYLVTFVRKGRANEPIGEFIRGIKELPEWTFGPQEELTHAWSVFWNAISFNPDLPPSTSSPSFESRIVELFQLSPTYPPRAPPTFHYGLLDLEGLDIKVRPTLNLDEHMTLEEDTLRILKLSRGSWNLCLTYSENLVAQALNIDTLGSEVLGSLYTLYRGGALMKKAGDMELVLVENDVELAMWTRLLAEYSKIPPRVLASRTLALQKLVTKRRAWWPSLVRDAKLQSSTQPILFYGSILAVISVISGVIQAIAGIWSVVLVYKPPASAGH